MPKKLPSPEIAAQPAEIPNFTPVPIKTHTGWTAERQRAFIEILAETASVRQAAIAVNMSKVSCYHLRKRPDAGEFRRAWDAALDCGIAHLKDLAFERAAEGELEPVWQRGKLVGYKRKFNNALLMFLLRQYGQDNEGKRVTVNYVRTRSGVAERNSQSGGAPQSGAAAEASVMTVQASGIKGKSTEQTTEAAAMIEQFSGVALDAAAEAEIAAALAACARREREYGGTIHDTSEAFVPQGKDDSNWQGSFEPQGGWMEDVEPFVDRELPWECIGDQNG